MTRALWPLLILAACAADAAPALPAPEPLPEALVTFDGRFPKPADALYPNIRALSAEQRVELTTSIRDAVRQCPYRRSLVASLYASHTVLARHHDPVLVPLISELEVEIALLDATGAGLPLPQGEDHLASLSGAALFDRAALQADPDPLARVHALIDVLPELVESMDGITGTALQYDDEAVTRLAGEQLPRKHALRLVEDRLGQLPSLAEPAASDVAAVRALLERLGGHGC